MDDRYITIAQPARHELKVKGSRFIGRTALVADAEAGEGELAAVRKTEHAATHNCYAYRVGPTAEPEFKYSDDGEPSGTAGRPIYDAICGRELTNTLVVVTRYFGGTKLGTGGLVRAYGEAAAGALDLSGEQEHFLVDQIRVTVEFAIYDQLERLNRRLGARQVAADFSDRVELLLEIRRSLIDTLVDEIVQLSSGKAKIERV
jgi:uncharacterized YigZ family protein